MSKVDFNCHINALQLGVPPLCKILRIERPATKTECKMAERFDYVHD
jgi:hypothetical protein